ncbi:hypothetical protein [uncultured Virgibacillus sp.]|nr:hypothetical protein [uncultured Virgibacillus sp.]
MLQYRKTDVICFQPMTEINDSYQEENEVREAVLFIRCGIKGRTIINEK